MFLRLLIGREKVGAATATNAGDHKNMASVGGLFLQTLKRHPCVPNIIKHAHGTSTSTSPAPALPIHTHTRIRTRQTHMLLSLEVQHRASGLRIGTDHDTGRNANAWVSTIDATVGGELGSNNEAERVSQLCIDSVVLVFVPSTRGSHVAAVQRVRRGDLDEIFHDDLSCLGLARPAFTAEDN